MSLACRSSSSTSTMSLFCVKGLARSLAEPANDRTILPNAPAPGRPAGPAADYIPSPGAQRYMKRGPRSASMPRSTGIRFTCAGSPLAAE